MKDPIKPIISIQKTNVQLSATTTSYNESGITYNEAGQTYGGLYEHDIVPAISSASSVTPSLKFNFFAPKAAASRTNKQLYDEQIVYNQTGFSYNQAGYAYGGLYGQDVAMLTASAVNISPSISLAGDFQAQNLAAKLLLTEDSNFITTQDGNYLILEG